jgi:hypothetical protein
MKCHCEDPALYAGGEAISNFWNEIATLSRQSGIARNDHAKIFIFGSSAGLSSSSPFRENCPEHSPRGSRRQKKA